MLLPRAGRWAENSPSWKIRVRLSAQLLQNNRLAEKPCALLLWSRSTVPCCCLQPAPRHSCGKPDFPKATQWQGFIDAEHLQSAPQCHHVPGPGRVLGTQGWAVPISPCTYGIAIYGKGSGPKQTHKARLTNTTKQTSLGQSGGWVRKGGILCRWGSQEGGPERWH